MSENTNEQTPTENVEQKPAEQSKPDSGNGYPEKTPLAEMSTEEQLAYWKAQSRKHEGEAKARADYDDMKAELEKYRQQNLTDTEKAIEAARVESRMATIAEIANRNVDTLVGAYVSMGRFTQEQADKILLGLNRAAFVDDDGAVKTDELAAYIGAIAPEQPAAPRRDPNQGNFPPTGKVAGVSAGSTLWKERHGVQ